MKTYKVTSYLPDLDISIDNVAVAGDLETALATAMSDNEHEYRNFMSLTHQYGADTFVTEMAKNGIEISWEVL